MSDQEIIAVLKSLLQAIEETKESFGLAAVSADSTDMKLLFTHYLHQREQFLAELHRLADALGIPVSEQADVAADVSHQERMQALDPTIPHKANELLVVCEQEENHVMSEYRKAIDQPLPPDVLHAVEVQGLEIKAAHDKLKYLSHLGQAA